MRWLGLVAALCIAVGGWGQSLGDVARASREQKKTTASKVVTDEDLETTKVSRSPGYAVDLGKELDRMRKILRGICDDPKTDHGRNLSDYDKKTITDGVKPLRVRVAEYDSVQKRYKDELAEMEKYYEGEFQKTFPHDRPVTQPDIDHVKALRQEYEGKKQDLVDRGERELKDYPAFQKELESVGEECPLAAKTVPD